MGFRRFILGAKPPEGSLEAEEEIARDSRYDIGR